MQFNQGKYFRKVIAVKYKKEEKKTMKNRIKDEKKMRKRKKEHYINY